MRIPIKGEWGETCGLRSPDPTGGDETCSLRSSGPTVGDEACGLRSSGPTGGGGGEVEAGGEGEGGPFPATAAYAKACGDQHTQRHQHTPPVKRHRAAVKPMAGLQVGLDWVSIQLRWGRVSIQLCPFI